MTWRYSLARELIYMDTGRYLLTFGQNLLVAGAAIKILWPTVPLVVMVAATPLICVSLNLLGRAYRRWGWQQESTSVATLENMSWLNYVFLIWWIRLLTHHRVVLDDIPPPGDLPKEIRCLLTRGHHP